MNHKSGISGDMSFDEVNDLLRVEMKSARRKYEAVPPEDFLELVRNADRILENCRKDLGVI